VPTQIDRSLHQSAPKSSSICLNKGCFLLWGFCEIECRQMIIYCIWALLQLPSKAARRTEVKMRTLIIFFVKCDVYGKLWYFIFSWLDFSTVFNGKVLQHIYQFGSFGGFSHKVQNSLNAIWLCVAWIIWKEHNIRIFQRKEDNLQLLCERVKL